MKLKRLFASAEFDNALVGVTLDLPDAVVDRHLLNSIILHVVGAFGADLNQSLLREANDFSPRP